MPLPFHPRRRASRRLQQRFQRAARKIALFNSVISALNTLSMSFASPPLHSFMPASNTPFPSSAQQRIYAHISACVDRFYAGRPASASSHADDESDGGTPFPPLLAAALAHLRQLQRTQHIPLPVSRGAAAFHSDPCDGAAPDPIAYLPQPSTAIPIVAARVSLPAAAATADLLSLLPPALAARYASAGTLRRPPDALPMVSPRVVRRRQPKVRLMATRREYLTLIRRMEARNMISFTTAPLVVNGLHGVPKEGDSIRLIIDARPANRWFAEPDHVELPTPDLLAKLFTVDGRPFAAAKGDLDNFYHRMRLPPSYWPIFALPPLRAGDVGAVGFPPDTTVWPCCTTLPMGWSHSVYLAQAAHEQVILSHTGLRPADRITPHNDFAINRLRWAFYLDDIFLFGPDPAAIDVELVKWEAGATASGVPPKPTKTVRPTFSPIECIGIQVDGTKHTFGLSPSRLHALIADTHRFLRADTVTGVTTRQLVGRWIWACLPFRPSLSVLSSAFRFAVAAGDRLFSVWSSVRAELIALTRLAPLLLISLRAPCFPSVVATDASSVGLGVVASRVPEHAQRACSRLSGRIPAHQLPLPPSAVTVAGSHRWSTIVASTWRNFEHINILELRAVSTGVRWALSHPAATGSRLLVLSDSAVAVASLAKGRSSSPAVNRRIRQIAALCLASGLLLSICWLPSETNPADEPSRRHQ